MRIPFDSLVLSGIAWELRALVGGQLQRAVQPYGNQIRLTFFHHVGREQVWLFSCHPEYARIHQIPKDRIPAGPASGFLDGIRARIMNAQLTEVKQIGLDRILELHFEGEAGPHRLIAELMGKHSNLILVGGDGRVVSAAKIVGPNKSVRPIVSGGPYRPPPFDLKPGFATAPSPEDVAALSPFLKKWIAAGGDPAEVVAVAQRGKMSPVLSIGHGAYPISVARLDLPESPRATLSEALHEHFTDAEAINLVEQLRASLVTTVERVLLAREVAVGDLQQALDMADRAAEFQLKGQLILAYGYGFLGQESIEAYDYEGHHVLISVDPELSPPENAEKYFSKAKKAKSRRGMVEEQLARIADEREELFSVASQIRGARTLEELQRLQEMARTRRWLAKAGTTALRKEDRPFEGNKIRELLGPNGYEVLYGEIATANDYLTQKVARPDDWWLHVRGQPSAHVVVRSNKKPDKVPREVLLFAAKVAVMNSPMKHSGYVDVDYTLRKYVRKPRGGKAGFVTYTHEKTLTIES